VIQVVEVCSGIGGLRLGLEDAGMTCIHSSDIMLDAVNVQRAVFGSACQLDVRELTSETLLQCDVLAAGFPCQPFSSSGNRSGFEHSSGNVFEVISRVVAEAPPPFLLLENVMGLLSNRDGNTMAHILRELVNLDYEVAWATVNAMWLGVAQSRPRVLFLASRHGGLADYGSSLFETGSSLLSTVFDGPLRALSIDRGPWERVDIPEVIKRTERVVGRVAGTRSPFKHVGFASKGHAWTAVLSAGRFRGEDDLGEICCPRFDNRAHVRSVRYWGHSGETKPYLKTAPLSHSIGTNIGAGPTFGVELSRVDANQREDLLEYANWSREQAGLLIFRLVPERASLLFGRRAGRIGAALASSGIPVTRQYELLGNMVAPAVGMWLGEVVRSAMEGY
jgi:site-specific DNA-cytosine methylase